MKSFDISVGDACSTDSHFSIMFRCYHNDQLVIDFYLAV